MYDLIKRLRNTSNNFRNVWSIDGLTQSDVRRILKFYTEQSLFTDPGDYAYLFDDLPQDINELCKIVQGLVIHFFRARDLKLPEERMQEMNTRYVSKILSRIIYLDDNSLESSRPIEKRFIGCCRDFATLFCSMARHQGIPTRTRSGFAPYIDTSIPRFKVDHTIAEFWDTKEERWRLVDPEQDDQFKEKNKIDFNTTDIPRDKFLLAGRVWQQYRNNKLDPDEFGFAPDERSRGAAAIRNRVIQDLAMINKKELLLWDTSNLMELHIVPTEEDLRLIDRVAELIIAGNEKFNEMRELYEREPKLKVPKVVNSYSPCDTPRSVVLRS